MSSQCTTPHTAHTSVSTLERNGSPVGESVWNNTSTFVAITLHPRSSNRNNDTKQHAAPKWRAMGVGDECSLVRSMHRSAFATLHCRQHGSGGVLYVVTHVSCALPICALSSPQKLGTDRVPPAPPQCTAPHAPPPPVPTRPSLTLASLVALCVRSAWRFDSPDAR